MNERIKKMLEMKEFEEKRKQKTLSRKLRKQNKYEEYF